MTHRPAWRIVAASNGAEGLSLVTRCLPDLVLLDLHLPDMDGITLLRALRESVLTSDLKIVVASADSKSSPDPAAPRRGADAYLVKPLNLAEVLKLLDGTTGPIVSPPS